ncbi:MAG TPA: PHP domain-containing protein, partial [Candidatus Polarisedimenticolia bacterium]|nr:PHP domain-containing protein [Candidatus Polarisedimenticolia bacterium]
MPHDYVPLACHSWFSLLRGVDSVESVCEGAMRIGARALALTDVNALYGALPFWETARDAGLTPLLGADIRGESETEPRAILLAASEQGYRRLCRIITERHRDDYAPSREGGAAFSLADLLRADREGLWVISPDLPLLEDLAR